LDTATFCSRYRPKLLVPQGDGKEERGSDRRENRIGGKRKVVRRAKPTLNKGSSIEVLLNGVAAYY